MRLQFTNFLCNDWENTYTLSYYYHQIGSMNYYPLFRVRSWNNGMRCMSFYILMVELKSVHVKKDFGLSEQNFDADISHWKAMYVCD